MERTLRIFLTLDFFEKSLLLGKELQKSLGQITVNFITKEKMKTQKIPAHQVCLKNPDALSFFLAKMPLSFLEAEVFLP